MNQDFDVFELFPDNSVCWRGRVSGAELARVKLEELVTGSKHRFFAINLKTRKTVQLNPGNSQIRSDFFVKEQRSRSMGNAN
jgi:hypothetical protein